MVLIKSRFMSTRERLLRLLNDRHFQSGSALGKRLGVSRAAIQQQIAALRGDGVPVHGVPRRGYRLAAGVSLLDAGRIQARLSELKVTDVTRLHIRPSVDSTNNELLRAAGALHGTVCLAEKQSKGRGRRGKHWVATPYRNVMLSLGWVYQEWPAAISALGLLAALAVSRALERFGIADVGIKWPNDLVWRGKKLGGVLVDLGGEAGGACRAVVGVGINVSVSAPDGERIDQPWTDLASITTVLPDRNMVAAAVIAELTSVLSKFPMHGFAGELSEWRKRHVLEGQQVEIVAEGLLLTGRVLGVDDSGALLLRDREGVRHKFYHGEVGLRAWR